MRQAVLIALVALMTAVPAAATQATTGLRGLVTRGPIAPVCLEGVPCSGPAKHVKLTFVRAGVTKTVLTGATGRYSILLAPGTDAVRVPSAKFGFRPRSAMVIAGRMTIRDFSIDTGIR